MTIAKLLVVTAFIAIGLALLRPLFGIAVSMLAFAPLAFVILCRPRRCRRLLLWTVIGICLVPPWAVSMGPFIATQRMFWGLAIAPDWFTRGYDIYRPVGFIWSNPSLTPYGYRFEETWQNLGLLAGRVLGVHSDGADLPVFPQTGG